MYFIDKTTLNTMSFDELKLKLANVSLPDFELLTDDMLSGFNVTILNESDKPECGAYETVIDSGFHIVDGKYYKTYEKIGILPEDESSFQSFLENEKANLKKEIAARRYNREVSGIILPNGTKIQTDRESQAQLNGAYTGLKNGFINKTWWKNENGWNELSLEDIEPVAKIVAEYVSGCFLYEKLHIDMIDEISTKEDLLLYVNERMNTY
jgi:hypothetical protein